MPTKRPQVLIIDDQMPSIALLMEYFRGQAVDVMVALSGDDGLRKAQLGKPDVILLDVFMPQMNGYEVCLKLKLDPRTSRIPVIFLSASVTLDSKLNGFSVGAADYICKPFNSEEVMARVFVHFKTSRQLSRLDDDPTQTEPAPSREIQIITEAITAIQDTSQQWLGTEVLARKIGVNERKLNDLFRRQFGMTVSEYQLNQRLENARWKLANSTQQIQLVARDAGYTNASDFSRAFRLRYGLRPRQYRQASGANALSFAPRPSVAEHSFMP